MRRRGLTWLLLTLMVVLAACEAETSLELTPEVVEGGVCPRPHDEVTGPAADDDWGSVTPVEKGIEFTVNEGYTATLCAKGGDRHNIITVTGPESGFLETPENNGGQIPDLSHWSVTDVTGEGSSSSTTTSTTSTTSPDDTTSTPGGDSTTTIDGETTITQGGGSTTTAGGEITTTTIGDVTITTAPGATTTTSDGPDVTEGGGDPTTTVEVGAGDITTTTAGSGGEGSEGTLDPSQEPSTTGDEVAGGSDETLPYTGTGQVSLSGLAGLLVAAGAILLLLVRRRSRED